MSAIGPGVPPDDGRLAVTVLGSDGSYPGPGGACSGYLVRAGGFCTWLDAGPGSMANLQLHIPLEHLDAVVISHAHPDHWSDLEGLFVAMRYYIGRQGLPVYAPQGVRDLMAAEYTDEAFDWHQIKDGTTAELGPVRWTWSQTDHPVETLAARAEAQGRALGYSADTGARWSLSSLGPGLDLALVEASLTTEAEGSVQHLSARQAGLTAADAGVERLVITHLVPSIDRTKAKAEASASFGGEVEVARVGQVWQV
ncbi:MAG TPA: MBL fold metallo-hydrolase [Acidimicrobiales bacterium]|nr:MBL fold metallo-hydrolase [Acidimicrobiales bacterium]